MADAELRNQRVYGARLYARAAAMIPQSRSIDVVLPIRCDEGNTSETFNDRRRCFGTSKALKQLLQDKACRGDGLAAFERLLQRNDFRNVRRHITAQGKRPDRRVNEQRHIRDRSAL